MAKRFNKRKHRTKNRVPAPIRSDKQKYAINQQTLATVKKLRSCLRDILGLESILCVCIDAYKNRDAVDPSCQAHDWRAEIDNLIKHYRFKLQDINEPDVYFVQGQDSLRIKIGCAKNPQDRVASMQTGSPEELVLVGILFGAGKHKEHQLHAKFIADEVHGEWFNPSLKLVMYIKENAWIVSEPKRSHVIQV